MAKRLTTKQRIEDLFQEIQAILRVAGDDAAWLLALQKRALQPSPGWKATLDAYLYGLHVGGSLDADRLAALRVRMAELNDAEPELRDLILPIVWVVLICAGMCLEFLLAPNLWQKGLLILCAAICGAYWAAGRPWASAHNFLRRKLRIVVLGLAGLAAVWLVLLVPAASVLVATAISRHEFKLGRQAVLEHPGEFPALKRFAHDQYGVDVVLGSVNESWALTSLRIPYSSPASIGIFDGYCVLNISRGGLLEGFAPAQGPSPAWISGVLMHEFGHCLDVRRDGPVHDGQPAHTYSLAPVDATHVRSLEDYVTASEGLKTMLWREALADLFAIGYWRLTVPKEADSLARQLRAERLAPGAAGATHATMCWIDAGAKAPPPATPRDIFAWADRLRSEAGCPLPTGAPRS